MRLLYKPSVNTVLRTVLRPWQPWIPEGLRFGVVAPFRLSLPGGQTVVLHGNETSYVSKVLFWEGVSGYEAHLFRIFMALASRARVVVDVGANLGYYSLLARVANPSARVVAFEPMPAALHYLHLNLAANRMTDVTVEAAALGDRDGEAVFHEARNPKFLHVQRHLTGASSFDVPGGRYASAPPVTVPTVTLDAYVKSAGLAALDVLKVDAEGAEAMVLRGADKVLNRMRPVVLFEADPGPTEAEVEKTLRRHDYLVYNARPEGIVPVHHLSPHNARWHDFVAVPRERSEEVAPFLVH